MDEEKNLMEETHVIGDSSGSEFACGDPQVEPRVGEEYQVEIPPMMSKSKRALFLTTPLDLNDSSNSFLIGLPIQVMWIDKHRKGDDNVDMNQSLRSLKVKRSRCSKKQRLNLEAVPAIPSSSWEDFEVASFVLGLYTFGKNFTQLKKFMESKGSGDISLFYYGKFYKSAKYHSWSDSRKKRNRKCVNGRKLYSGWRQQQLLSRLIPSLPDESQKQMLINVSKSFAEGNMTLESYVSDVKDRVGLKLLVDAVAIGKEKEDLTVITTAPVKTKPWFTVSSKACSVSSLRAYTSVDIINELTGASRLSKARCNDIFWEAVWPRLLARGWHSEQPKDRGYYTSKDYIVFIVPGVKKFSREKLVKGGDYFDSVSDILTKVALEPELLEFETGGGENGFDQSDQEECQRHRYLRSPCSSNRGTQRMKFTVVDTTSLAAGGKLCDLRNLNAEPKTCLGNKDSCVKKSQMDDHPMRFTIIDTSLDHRDKLSGIRRLRHLPRDDSSVKEKVKTNYHSVNSAPLLKRTRLSTCVRKEESVSRKSLSADDTKSTESVQHQNSTRDKETVLSVDYMKFKSDRSKNITTGPSSSLVEIQETPEIEPNGLNSIFGADKQCSLKEIKTGIALEIISSVQEPNRLCSVSDSDKNLETSQERVSSEQEQAVELPSKDLGTTQERVSSEQQVNTDGPRRQSTRKRPLTTRALEALESGFLTNKKSTIYPKKKRESTRKEKLSAKACDRRQHLSDNGNADLVEHRGEGRGSFVKNATTSKPLDQIEDSKPSFLLNEAKALDRIQDSKLKPTEHPKLPPIVLKLSLKRSRGGSET